MATRDQTAAAIEPGSVAYGDRGPLEDGIPSAGAGGMAPPPPTPGPAPSPEASIPPVSGSPLDMLMSGEFPQDMTGGIPGMGDEDMPPPSKAELLRTIAVEAKSISLRAQARALLKVMYQRGQL